MQCCLRRNYTHACQDCTKLSASCTYIHVFLKPAGLAKQPQVALKSLSNCMASSGGVSLVYQVFDTQSHREVDATLPASTKCLPCFVLTDLCCLYILAGYSSEVAVATPLQIWLPHELAVVWRNSQLQQETHTLVHTCLNMCINLVLGRAVHSIVRLLVHAHRMFTAAT